MTDSIERSLTGYRYAATNFGDDLPAVALRELGDANRWQELVWINDLLPPYLTDDADAVTDRVLLTGSMILIPSSGQQAYGRTESQVYLADAVLSSGLLQVDRNGDLGVVSGRSNLKQQLLHRLNTPIAQLTRHPTYGCDVHRLRGAIGGPTAADLGADYVRTALESDFRISRVNRAVAEISGDVTRINAEAMPITGGLAVDISSAGDWNPWPWDEPRPPESDTLGGWGTDWDQNFSG
jgi:phage baseplate assembly protein W